MPYQGNLGSSGQGSGSCGVGVILSARDIIQKGLQATLNEFDWSYKTMRKHRQQLMVEITVGLNSHEH